MKWTSITYSRNLFSRTRNLTYQIVYFLVLGKITTFDEELPQLNYYFIPVILITLGTYFIADIFFGVYAMGVDTLFLCFLEVSYSRLFCSLKRNTICQLHTIKDLMIRVWSLFFLFIKWLFLRLKQLVFYNNCIFRVNRNFLLIWL